MATKEQLGEFIRDIIRAEVQPIAEAVLELQERIDDLEDDDDLGDAFTFEDEVPVGDAAVVMDNRTESVQDGHSGINTDVDALATVPSKGMLDEQPQDHTSDEVNALQARLDAVKAMHRLEAIPIAQGRDEGAWEVRCVVCNPQNFVTWKKGDPDPVPCKTWRTADGQEIR